MLAARSFLVRPSFTWETSRAAQGSGTAKRRRFVVCHVDKKARLRDTIAGDIDRAGRNEVLAQCWLVDLAGGVARQGIDEFYRARALEARQIGFAMRINLRLGYAVSRLHRDDGHADLAPLLAGNADHGGLRDRGELMQHILDLGRIDVFAAGNVHVLPAIDDVVKAFLVDPRGIAGMQPAVGEGRRVGVRPVPVAGRDVRSPDPELTELA